MFDRSDTASIVSAVSRPPNAMAEFGRPVRSASAPPNGTDTMLIHTATLIRTPASASEAPRHTSKPGPKLTKTTKLG